MDKNMWLLCEKFHGKELQVVCLARFNFPRFWLILFDWLVSCCVVPSLVGPRLCFRPSHPIVSRQQEMRNWEAIFCVTHCVRLWDTHTATVGLGQVRESLFGWMCFLEMICFLEMKCFLKMVFLLLFIWSTCTHQYYTTSTQHLIITVPEHLWAVMLLF